MTGSSRRRFRPNRWATLTVALCLPTLIALGVWQVQRLGWKAELVERVEARLAEPPTTLPFTIHVADAFDYVPARLEGAYRPGRQIVLTSRFHDRVPGARLIAGFETSFGQSVLVDRGWVPTLQPDPANWPLPDGMRRLDGVLRLGGRPSWFPPENDGPDGLWYWRDLPAMADTLGLADPLPLMLVVERDQHLPAPGGTTARHAVGGTAGGPTAGTADVAEVSGTAGEASPPIPVATGVTVDLRNQHLNYALTWFSLAVALLAIYAVHGYRRDP